MKPDLRFQQSQVLRKFPRNEIVRVYVPLLTYWENATIQIRFLSYIIDASSWNLVCVHFGQFFGTVKQRAAWVQTLTSAQAKYMNIQSHVCQREANLMQQSYR